MCSTAPYASAASYSGQKRWSASATPFTLLNSIAPGRRSSSIARRNSVTDAAGSLSGSVASAENRGPRSAMIFANASFTSFASVSGVRRRLDVRPGRRERDDLRVHAFLLEHLLAVRDVAMPGDRDVVVAGVVDVRVACRVDRDADDALAGAERVEVLGRIEVVVDVNDRHGSRFGLTETRGAQVVDGKAGEHDQQSGRALDRLGRELIDDDDGRRDDENERQDRVAPHAIRRARSRRGAAG